MTVIYLRDIEPGQTFETGDYLMSPERIKAFAREFDPQPMHLNERIAESGPFGGLTASGWHTLSITMRLMAEARPFGDTPLIGVGVNDIRFLEPVFAETSIYVCATVTGKRESSKTGRGFVTMHLTTKNRACDKAVLSEDWTVMVPNPAK